MLEDKIYQDYIEALKQKDKFKADFLSFIRAELKNAAIELRKDTLSDDEVLKVLQKQRKRLEDTKESVEKALREDLRESVERELAFLSEYLPQPLSEEETERIIQEVIGDTGASSMKDMGKVMKEVLQKTAGRVDPKKVSQIVKNKLSSA